jgi:adenosylcobinamide-GDP ribazoletransferase
MKPLLLSLQFLTIIPIKVSGTVSEKEVGRSAIFFPLVGAFQGAIAASAVFPLALVFPREEIVTGLIIALLIFLTGGFHLDGLADTFDAVAVRATGNAEQDREKRLAVMGDSSTGAIGVTAIVVTVLLKYVLISSLFREDSPLSTAYILFLMPIFSKWCMLPAMCHGNAARTSGLGRIFIDHVTGAIVLGSLVLLGVLYGGATLFMPASTLSDSLVFFLVAVALLYVFSLIWVHVCRRKFGGSTGDTLGALGEMTDVLFLLIAFVWF